MWRSIEEVLRELKEEGIIEDIMKSENGLPPGFRFHPTDEELITCYLASKVFNNNNNNNNNNSVSTNIIINNNINNNATNNMFLSNYFCSCAQIAEVDLTRCEPWDLPESAKMGEKEWYLFSLRDRKYPSGLRTNRATETGYWKATGKDRQVYATSIIATNASGGGGGGGGSGVLIGMKKTLVFYQGRAPRGAKTKWVMHEYRLDGHFSAFRLSSKEEWVICRIFQKNGEKKASPMIHHPPLPLSPFLRTLPALQELNTTTTTTTSTMTQTVADNSLLHSLLLNPLPNFSSISGSDPIFPSTTPSADMNISSTLLNSLPRLTSNTAAAATATATAAATKQENWLDRICPQEHQTQHYQNQNQYQYHDDHIFDQTVENHHDEKEMLLLNHTVNNQYPAESWCFH